MELIKTMINHVFIPILTILFICSGLLAAVTSATTSTAYLSACSPPSADFYFPISACPFICDPSRIHKNIFTLSERQTS